MKTCIPFWKIKYGSAIAFYGCGNNSKFCYEQLIESGYCNLVCVVDKNPQNKCLANMNASTVEECCNRDFKYILITVINPQTVSEIRNNLIDSGIETEKILTLYDFPTLNNYDFIFDEYEFENYLNFWYKKRKKYAKKAGEYYPELGRIVYDKDDVLLFQIKKYLPLIKNINIRLIIACMMYEANVFDSICFKTIMSCLKESTWIDDTAYGLIVDTTYIAFLRPYAIYPGYYKDKTELLHRLNRYYDLRVDENNKPKDKKKILITANAYTPNNVADAVSMLIKTYSIELTRMGYEVCIFVLGTSASVKSDTFFLDRIIGHNECLSVDYNEEEHKKLGVNVDFVPKIYARDRLNRNIKEIVRYNPYFILDMSDEMFPEVETLIDYYAVIYLPMRGNAYGTVADAFIFSDVERVKKDNKKYRILDETKLYQIQLGNMGSRENRPTVYSRKELGFEPKDFLVITVGSRLQFEITDDLIYEMCKLLDEKPNIKWILVGETVQSECGNFKEKINLHQIINWGFEDNLVSLYGICDVFLNPDRRGGGVSLRTAMREGLPIVMRDFPSAVRPYMSPSHIVNGDYSAVVKRIQQLSEDEALYNKIRLETKQQMEEYSSENDTKKILRLCEEIANGKYSQI